MYMFFVVNYKLNYSMLIEVNNNIRRRYLGTVSRCKTKFIYQEKCFSPIFQL